MFEALSKDRCCGCMACLNACSLDLIDIYQDELGFSYPILKEWDKCINCNKCNSVCPNKQHLKKSIDVGDVVCAFNLNSEYRRKSSSGGIFPALCKVVLDKGGICFGAAFNNSFGVQHVKVDSINDIYKIVGSKYLESTIGTVYREVKKELDKERLVLFSGTPCQLSGLTTYLGKDYNNLLKIDLFCYGIPSPKVWEKWLEFISNGRRVEKVNFRDKTYGWDNYALCVEFSDKSSYCKTKKEDLYIATFSKGSYIRESCYSCTLKAFPRCSDLTLGDFQELKYLFPHENPKEGWSMIKISTEKGKKYFDIVKDNLFWTCVDAERMNAVHPELGKPSIEHPNRKVINLKINEIPIYDLLNRYATPTLKMKLDYKKVICKEFIKNILKNIGLYTVLKRLKVR